MLTSQAAPPSEQTCSPGDLANINKRTLQLSKKPTNEQIGKLDSVPKILPDLRLRRPLLVNKIRANLNVRPIDNGQIGPGTFDERN